MEKLEKLVFLKMERTNGTQIYNQSIGEAVDTDDILMGFLFVFKHV